MTPRIFIARLFVVWCLIFTAQSASSKPLSVEEARERWPYKVRTPVQVPMVQSTTWPKNEIDHFILAKLEERKLRPVSPADKRTLIRRATFDLTGLPPTPAEVEAFVSDSSEGAFARVVERLLASPAYGERWGRHWLDVVRYTDAFDSRGIGGEADVPEAYRYRDWVIQAFNNDLPYDQFIRQQIAGDLIATSGSDFQTNALVATGVYVIGEWGTGDADKEKMLTDIVDDQIDLTGRAFLGLTLACARCHDHKFDPISTEDYYGLSGIFFSSHILPNPGAKTAGSATLRVPMAPPADVARRKAVEDRIAEVLKEIDSKFHLAITQFVSNSLPETTLLLEALWDWKHSTNIALSELATNRNLNATYVAAWRDLLGWNNGTPLTRLKQKLAEKPGVDAWLLAAGPDTPSVTINSTHENVSITTLTLPAQSVSVHPAPKSGVAVVWASPLRGEIQIEAEFIDSDDKCGDGVEWMLIQRDGRSAKEIKRGKLANGGNAKLMEQLQVSQGSELEFVIGPAGGYECDTTTIYLRITESSGGGHKWDLARDVLAAPRSVPIGDSYGHAAVWHFKSATAAPKLELSSSPLLHRWNSETNSDQRTFIAVELQRALLNLSSITDTNHAEIKLYKAFTDTKSSIWNVIRENQKLISEQFALEIASFREKEKNFRADLGPAFPVTHALQEGGTPESAHTGFKDARVHIRGRYDRLGDAVPRRFPTVLSKTSPEIAAGTSGRLELARWIASPENPLTARVMVNRLWQHHFGEGIVRTPNNFGKLGMPPTHSDLLDFLADRFIAAGWSMKAMHRLIMLSATYQQSTIPGEGMQHDPDNQLFGRQNRRRLEAEAIRDSLLAVSGALDMRQGGKAIRELETARRTLYVMTIRSDRATYQTLFDAADPASIVEKRIDSTIAPQALFLLNHPFVLNAADKLARRLDSQTHDPRKRIEWLYELLYARAPSAREVDLGLAHVASGEMNWANYCHVLLGSNEFVYVD